jgi:hypothetical protein
MRLWNRNLWGFSIQSNHIRDGKFVALIAEGLVLSSVKEPNLMGLDCVWLFPFVRLLYARTSFLATRLLVNSELFIADIWVI